MTIKQKKEKNATQSSVIRLPAHAMLQIKTLAAQRDKLNRKLHIASMELETYVLKELEKIGYESKGSVRIKDDGQIVDTE